MTGNDLKQKRELLELTQEELANRLGVVSSSVARWEQLKDKEIPSPLLGLALETVQRKITEAKSEQTA